MRIKTERKNLKTKIKLYRKSIKPKLVFKKD